MFEKKLNEKDLNILRSKTRLINDYNLVIQSLEIEKQNWLKSILPNYKLDVNKKYNADLRTGKVKEIKE